MLKINNNELLAVFIGLFISYSSAVADTCSALLASGDTERAVEAGRKQADAAGWVCAGKGLGASARYPEALEALKKAESLASTPYERVLIAIATARTIRDSGDTEQAIAAYQQGFNLATQLKQKQGQRVNLNEMGQLFLAKNEANAALERFSKAYTYAANDNERAESNELIALAYRTLGDYTRAVEYQLKGVSLERRSGELGSYLYAALELADLRTLSKDFRAARKDVTEVLAMSRDAKSDYWIARSLLAQGKLEMAEGNVLAGKQSLQQSLKLAQQVDDADLVKAVSKAMNIFPSN